MFRAFKRIFIWLGLMAEQATETDAINQAVDHAIKDTSRDLCLAQQSADHPHGRPPPLL